MTATERRATLVLAAILILRMSALFMVLPVLAPYALELAGSPMLAVGLAVGAYGLTQALLQIPFGWLSDRIGRKPVIAGGLAIFSLGSLLAAWAPDIDTLVLARLVQGGGAIAAASTALLADLTRESVRTTAMAIIGASIGASFLMALVIGPALLSVTDVPGLFVLSACAAGLALVLLLFMPAAPPTLATASQASVFSPRLLELDLGVFALHAVLASLFIGLPLLLIAERGLPMAEHWKLYLPTMAASLLPVFPLIRYLEKRGGVDKAMPWAVLLLLLACLSLAWGGLWLPAALWAFFVAFNFLEASLPSMVSRLAPAGARGRAMGVFSSAQFLGAFAGAAGGGLVLARFDARGVVMAAAAWATLWLLVHAVRNGLFPALNPSWGSGAGVEAGSRHQISQTRRANESRN